MVLQFNGIYGTDVNSVASWQGLCRVLGILPVPPTLEECQRVSFSIPLIFFILNLLQVVTNTYVNIVDLVDARGTRVVTKFPSEKALSIYTLETRKIFPRENAYAGGLLRALLRRILDPPDEPSRQGQRRGTVRRVRRSR